MVAWPFSVQYVLCWSKHRSFSFEITRASHTVVQMVWCLVIRKYHYSFPKFSLRWGDAQGFPNEWVNCICRRFWWQTWLWLGAMDSCPVCQLYLHGDLSVLFPADLQCQKHTEWAERALLGLWDEWMKMTSLGSSSGKLDTRFSWKLTLKWQTNKKSWLSLFCRSPSAFKCCNVWGEWWLRLCFETPSSVGQELSHVSEVFSTGKRSGQHGACYLFFNCE